MDNINEKIDYFKKKVDEFIANTGDIYPEVEYVNPSEFNILLAGVHSLINRNNFTKLVLQDATGASASQDIVTKNLIDNYGINDADSATQSIGRACFRGAHWQFMQFSAVDSESIKNDMQEMSPQSKEKFLKCKEFSDALSAAISPKGYLGWDVSLGIDIMREAVFCDYFEEPTANKMLADIVKPVLKTFNNWVEYALSVVAGGTYIAYKNSDFNMDEAVGNFDYLLDKVNRLFNDDTVHVWRAYNWYKKKEYFPTLDVKNLKTLVKSEQGCFVSDRISIDGEKPCFVYREEPFKNFPDSGWRFFAGDESKEYMADRDKSNIFQLNVIANFDDSIIPLLDAEVNTAFIRKHDEDFIEFKTASDAMKKGIDAK